MTNTLNKESTIGVLSLGLKNNLDGFSSGKMTNIS